MDIRTKRVYEQPDRQDGCRVLVDRVWPRGMTKKDVRADVWAKDAAPSTQLRQWFNHDRFRWETFKKRYAAELDARPDVTADLIQKAAEGRLTLLYSARDTEYNQAVALRAYLLARTRKKSRPRRKN